MSLATSVILSAILLHGPITDRSASDFKERVDEGMANGQKIFMVDIDSHGGSVDAAGFIAGAMTFLQKEGTRFICFANGNAQSAAFLIYLGCDERVSYVNSLFMHHEMSIGGMAKASEWLGIAQEAMSEQEQINIWVTARLKLTSFEDIRLNYEAENDLSAEELKELSPLVHTICTLNCTKVLSALINK